MKLIKNVIKATLIVGKLTKKVMFTYTVSSNWYMFPSTGKYPLFHHLCFPIKKLILPIRSYSRNV